MAANSDRTTQQLSALAEDDDESEKGEEEVVKKVAVVVWNTDSPLKEQSSDELLRPSWSGVITYGPEAANFPRPDRTDEFAADLRDEAAAIRSAFDNALLRLPEDVALGSESDVIDYPTPPINDREAEYASESRRDMDPRLKYPEGVPVRLVVGGVAQKSTAQQRVDQQIVHVICNIATEIRIPSRVLRLRHRGKVLSDWIRLRTLSTEDNGELVLNLESIDPRYVPIPDFQLKDDDFFKARLVQVSYKDKCGRPNCLTVEVNPPRYDKAFIGGYRNKLTGVEFHHASIQTLPPPLDFYPDGSRLHRETQTTRQRNSHQQTSRNTATQMTGVGFYVTNVTDKLIKPRPYTSADDYLAMKLRKIIIIQKYWRRFLAKCRVQRLKAVLKEIAESEKQAEKDRAANKQRRLERKLEQRIKPRTRQDFELLYNDLEKWRQSRVAEIDATLTGSERKLALSQLFDEECCVLKCIRKQQIDAVDWNAAKHLEHFLSKSSAPKIWHNSDGLSISVDTAHTIRARQLAAIYQTLCETLVSDSERTDLLITVRNIIKVDRCPLTRDLIELMNREVDLVTRGYGGKLLRGLRKRISSLFMQYIKTPKFNPEIEKFLKVSKATNANKRWFLCEKCDRFLLLKEFQLDSGEARLKVCYDCDRLENEARERVDTSNFRRILDNVKLREDEFNDGGRIAHLIQIKDIRCLVTSVWGSKSMISGHSDLNDLELYRWDTSDHWSPWNCILLTVEEGICHQKLKDVNEDYAAVFVSKVKTRHAIARKNFMRLPETELAMPLTCDPDPGAMEEAMNVEKISPPARLQVERCEAARWPVQVKYDPRRPAYLPTNKYKAVENKNCTQRR